MLAFGLPAAPQLIRFFQQRFGPRTPYLSSPISSSNLCACWPKAALAESPECVRHLLHSLATALVHQQQLPIVAANLHHPISLVSVSDTQPAIVAIPLWQLLPWLNHYRCLNRCASIPRPHRRHPLTSSLLWLMHPAMRSCAAIRAATHRPNSLAACSRRCGAAVRTGTRVQGGPWRSRAGCRSPGRSCRRVEAGPATAESRLAIFHPFASCLRLVARQSWTGSALTRQSPFSTLGSRCRERLLLRRNCSTRWQARPERGLSVSLLVKQLFLVEGRP